MDNKNLVTPRRDAKRPSWTRTLDVILRTAHVAVTSVLFGGAVCEIPLDRLHSWNKLVIATGCALVASEVYHCRHWPYQIRGILGILHLGLLGVVHWRPELAVPVLTVVLVLGMLGSHMPKSIRYWSVLHRRVVPAG